MDNTKTTLFDNAEPITETPSPSPSPWKKGGEYANSMDEIEDAKGRTIAVAWTRTSPKNATVRAQFYNDSQGQANFNLMLAAPELLEALIYALPLVEEGSADEINLSYHAAAIAKAKAAIAKAKGE